MDAGVARLTRSSMVLGRPWFLARLVPQSPRARAPQRHPEGEGVRCEGSASGTLALTNHGRTDMVVGRDSRMVARRVQYGRALVDWASRGTRTRTRTVVYKAGRRITSPSSHHTCNPLHPRYTLGRTQSTSAERPQPLQVPYHDHNGSLILLARPSMNGHRLLRGNLRRNSHLA